MHTAYTELCAWPDMLGESEAQGFRKLVWGNHAVATHDSASWSETIRQIRRKVGAVDKKTRHVADPKQRQSPEVAISDVPSGSLAFTDFALTPQNTILLSLIEVTLSWNYVIPDSYCCAYHYLWKFMIPHFSKQLASNICQSQRTFESDYVQCHKCGLVEDDAPDHLDNHGFCELCRLNP